MQTMGESSDADLCDSRPVRLALDSSNRVKQCACISNRTRIRASRHRFSAGSRVSLCITFGVSMEAMDGTILWGKEEREYSVCELVGHE